LNADRAVEIKTISSSQFDYENLLLLAQAGLTTNELSLCQHICHKLMEELSLVTKYPVLYTVDEHNEIWKAGKQEHPFVRSFTIASGCCAGVCLLFFRFFLSSFIIEFH
jgi:hypothetical protein